VAPATKDATKPAEMIGNGEKVCFFASFYGVLIKKNVNHLTLFFSYGTSYVWKKK
jgi:hypothetical protein